jgi:nucleotide-binding universal stress UspA family protein
MSAQADDAAEIAEDQTPIEGVVVGFDGSASAALAVDWAAAAAAAYGEPLTLLQSRPDAEGEVVELEDRDEAHELLGPDRAQQLDAVARRVVAAHPGLEVRAVVHPEAPVAALLDASGTADIIAMGSRGLEGFRGLLLGSTTMHVAPHARCPVVVLYEPDEETAAARADARHPAEVVVGYDGSTSADLALAFALRHAAATGLGVAVIVVTKSRRSDAAVAVPADGEGLAEPAAELVRSAAQVAQTRPEVAVRYLHAHGRPAGVLIAEAAGAPLAVVGARGLGGFAQLVLGSVGLQMLMHAQCPVAVVHTRAAP